MYACGASLCDHSFAQIVWEELAAASWDDQVALQGLGWGSDCLHAAHEAIISTPGVPPAAYRSFVRKQQMAGDEKGMFSGMSKGLAGMSSKVTGRKGACAAAIVMAWATRLSCQSAAASYGDSAASLCAVCRQARRQ